MKGGENITNTELLYNAIKVSPLGGEKDHKGYCKVCGKSIIQGIPERKVLSANFTNYDECKYRKSTYICIECASVMKEADLRRNNFIADKDKIYLFKKNDLEKHLFNLSEYVSGEFVVGITRSFKKHNSFRCKVNNNPNKYYIREEDKEYIFDVIVLKKVYNMLNEAYLSFSKDELLTGIYKSLSVDQFGLEKFKEYENTFRQYRGMVQFDLLVYMMNSEKRNEIIKGRKGKSE